MAPEIEQLFANRDALAIGMDDFHISPMAHESTMSNRAKRLLGQMKPFMDQVNWEGSEIPGTPESRKAFKATKQLIVAQMLANLAQRSERTWHQEATLAGTDIPAYKQQLVRTVMKSLPSTIAFELFPVVPLTQSTGKVAYRVPEYDSVFTGSSPNTVSGDDVSDISKFNTGYSTQATQRTNLNLMKFRIALQTVDTETHGVCALTSLQAHHQMSAEFGEDLNQILSNEMIGYLPLVMDRMMIDAALANVPVGHAKTWTRNPTINGVAWANQTPSEKNEYAKDLWNTGILSVFTAIYNTIGIRPNWAVAGTAAAEDLSRLSSFNPIRVDDNTFAAQTGRLRDVGTLDNGGLRILVDRMINTNTILFGYRPTNRMDPALTLCPWIPVGLTDKLATPRSLSQEVAAYTIFGIAQPSLTYPDSSVLGDVYGKLTIS